MNRTEHRRKTWYCPDCGRTLGRGNEALTMKVVCDCNTLLLPALVVFWRDKPDPDPLEALLIPAAGSEQTGGDL